jgi:lipopolysaccharide export system protein LptA
MRGEKVIAGRIVKIFICLTTMMIMTPLWQTDNARAGAKQRTPIDREQPIQIVSDRLEAYHEKRMVVFTGNAVATQGERTIRSDRLTLYYREDKKTAGRSKAETEGIGNLDKVEATGHVTITEGDRIVTGEEAVFDQEAQKITVTGNAVMREGANIIRGDRIVVFLDENRGVVDSVNNKRVTATIYPGETQKKKP